MQFTNPATGEVVNVVSETPELLVMRVTWPRPGHRAIAHIHPGMQERWQPALRWTEFLRRLFAGEPPAELLEEYAAEVQVG